MATSAMMFRRCVALDNGELVATGALLVALETTPSRPITAEAPGHGVTPLQSFASRDGSFCREYRAGGEGGQTFAGVACRQAEGAWRIAAQVETPPSPETPQIAPKKGGYETAAGPEALNAVVDSLTKGRHPRRRGRGGSDRAQMGARRQAVERRTRTRGHQQHFEAGRLETFSSRASLVGGRPPRPPQILTQQMLEAFASRGGQRYSAASPPEVLMTAGPQSPIPIPAPMGGGRLSRR